ncbi:DUF4276 family protein [Chitinophaga sp.]|uniref:DUF4276 family protein n=1 Tax=Chitinophaga sp. TaxID=1869181 RepID=UPI0031DAC448
MHYVLFTEELSAEAALLELLPKLIDLNQHTFQILVHGGKNDLLKKLPSKLSAMASMVANGYRFIILVDRDKEDCIQLKEQLEKIAQDAGLYTKSNPTEMGMFSVVNRIVIEELESWFMGDPSAVESAYPGIKRSVFEERRYRIPDAIKGGTCETLERILRRASYFRAGLAKIEAARNISKYMDPDVNRSQSFQYFVEGIRSLA